jgi:endonuclease/exonuclease/phosphatase family metal-dependent hydrolase
MPFYNDLRPNSDPKKKGFALVFPDEQNFSDSDKKRTIDNLLRLRNDLDNKIPRKTSDRSLLLATWNIKEFGHLNDRIPESYFYIAEVVSKFDLVAIQEVKSGLDDLYKIMKLLGSTWKYIITDITEGSDGNRERFAYIYDSRKVQPSGLSGEIVLWDKLTENSTIKQLKRTPAITGFKAGWKSFAIINVHLHPGDDDDDVAYRSMEIELLLKALKEKERKNHLWNENLIVLGDMNLYRDDTTMVTDFNNHGYIESASLAGLNTNVSETQIYDRIFFKQNSFFDLLKDENGKERAAVFDVFDSVFRDDQWSLYNSYMLAHKNDPTTLNDEDDFIKYYDRYWKRSQLSDHNPVWIEIDIDSSDGFLKLKKDQLEQHT